MSRKKSIVNVETGEVLPRLIRRPLDRPHVSTVLEGVSRTEQSHKEACCVNRVMSHVARTGVMPPSDRVANYGDVSHLNRPYAEMLSEARVTSDRLHKYTAGEKEKIRLAKIAQRKKDADDAAKYRASVASADKSAAASTDKSTTEPQK